MFQAQQLKVMGVYGPRWGGGRGGGVRGPANSFGVSLVRGSCGTTGPPGKGPGGRPLSTETPSEEGLWGRCPLSPSEHFQAKGSLKVMWAEEVSLGPSGGISGTICALSTKELASSPPPSLP